MPIILFAYLLVLLATLPVQADQTESQSDWQWKSTSTVEGSPGVKHIIWETARPPFGAFDKIALHRFVYDGKDRKKRPRRGNVMFHLPGTWDTAWKNINAPEFENHIFFANNGYDVYSLDYRTSYLPNLPLDAFDASMTAQWTYAVFREDIKACVDKAKQISKTRKVFLSGFSRGGRQVWIYANKYWQSDLKGLIGLDGGPPFASSTPSRTQEEYDSAVQEFIAGGEPLLTSGTTYAGYNRMQHAAIMPEAQMTVGYATLDDCLTNSVYYNGAPPDGSTIATVGDLLSYFYYYAWGQSRLTNYYDGMIDQHTLLLAQAGTTLYWPAIQNIEQETDPGYGDKVADIDLPVIYFGGILGCGNDGAACANPDMTFKCAGDDVTVVHLPGFGHMDVMWGTHSLDQVKKPLLEWMNSRG